MLTAKGGSGSDRPFGEGFMGFAGSEELGHPQADPLETGSQQQARQEDARDAPADQGHHVVVSVFSVTAFGVTAFGVSACVVSVLGGPHRSEWHRCTELPPERP
jgi:hypothetical protein